MLVDVPPGAPLRVVVTVVVTGSEFLPALTRSRVPAYWVHSTVPSRGTISPGLYVIGVLLSVADYFSAGTSPRAAALTPVLYAEFYLKVPIYSPTTRRVRAGIGFAGAE